VSASERDKWDERYRAGAYEDRTHPTALLAGWLPHSSAARPRGRALDVACGAGRNALYLAAQGFTVDALDISQAALDRARGDAERRGLDVSWICGDLEHAPDDVLPSGPYDLIVWVRYVNPTLHAPLASRLAPGGYLLCEQHLVSSDEVAGPRNPAFRLQPEQLRAAAEGLEVVHYYEGIVRDPDDRAVALAQLIAQRRR
jgi:SAM-dependent methyltransferase